MKVLIHKSSLETVLVNTQPYLEKKDLSQITSHILIKTFENSLEIKATDYEIGLTYFISSIKIVDEGVATVNGKKLLDIIKILKDDEVTLEAIGDHLYIKQKNSKYKLPMFNPENFPEFPTCEDMDKFEIESRQLVKSIKKISPTIDLNNPKFELNGALIDIKEEYINIVGTDTKRMGIYKINTQTSTPSSLIIPKKAINEIQKIYDSVEIFYNQTTLIAKTEHYQFFTKLINGKFPDYEMVIPKNITINILLNREKMVEAIKQIAIISHEVKVTFCPQKIIFESLNSDNIEAKTEIEFETKLEKEIFLVINSRYMLDFLTNIDESEFNLGYADNRAPFVLECGELKTIVMPIII